MSRIEDLEIKVRVLEELSERYGGKTLDNVLFNISTELKYLKSHGSTR